MIDISSVDTLEITISHDGKKLWINTSDGCKFRAYNIAKLIIKDESGRISWPFTNAELYEVGQVTDAKPIKEEGYDKTKDRYFEPNQGAD